MENHRRKRDSNPSVSDQRVYFVPLRSHPPPPTPPRSYAHAAFAFRGGKFEDLVRAMSVACSLGSNETLLVAEIYNGRIVRYLEELTDSLTLIREQDQLVAYRLMRKTDSEPLVVFMHQKLEEQYMHGSLSSEWKAFGIPLVARVGILNSGADIYSLFTSLLRPFLKSSNANLDDGPETTDAGVECASPAEDTVTADRCKPTLKCLDVEEVESSSYSKIQFYLTDEKGLNKKS
ncbi:hypothetical protein MLD38_004112 [Melastoma candidum]|uniref:Uncharacterized protein n=1 Tax=Melastoma candidum TaxID=119954 RepID=A0ACB9S679_9MYRT|nr:hypothetical protein MLD38_004112 [Melastoma candidum]